jgi:hypothetical protein
MPVVDIVRSEMDLSPIGTTLSSVKVGLSAQSSFLDKPLHSIGA